MRTTIVLLACCLLGVACQRVTVVQIRQQVSTGQYPAASTSIEELYEGEDNDLVRHFELGLVKFAAGDYAGAVHDLTAAGDAVEYFRSEKFADTLGKLTINDTMAAYSGDAFEHIQVQYYRSLAMALRAQWQEGVYRPVAHGILPNDGLDASRCYGEAINFSQGMVLHELKATEYEAGRKRYIDDPFARCMVAAYVHAADRPLQSDWQAANACLIKAAEAYPEEGAKLAGDKNFRYEAHTANQVFTTLLHRTCMYYDPAGFARRAPKLPAPRPIRLGEVDEKKLKHPAALPEGWGSILVLHHAGFVSEPQALTIGLITHRCPIPRRYTRRFRIGGLHFWADGPGVDICTLWGGIPIPDKWAKALAPGGAAVVKFEVPVHDYDHPNPPPATLTVNLADGGTGQAPLEVCSDLDAYARATLKDNQLKVVLRTLIRTAVKQGIVAGSAKAIRESDHKHAKAIAFGVNLLGSLLASGTEVADLRSVNLLPDRVEAVLVDVPAGTHRLVLHAPGWPGGGDLGEVNVKPRRLAIVPARTY